MINYLQSNQHNLFIYNKMITQELWEAFITDLKSNKSNDELVPFITNNCIQLNISVKDFIKEFINYLIHNKKYTLSNDWLTFFKTIIHSSACSNLVLNYFLFKIKVLYISL